MPELVPMSQETRDYVRSIALRIVRNPADADDITQDALLLAYRYRDAFRGDSQYKTWLHRVTHSAALMFLRKRRRYDRETSGARGADAQECGLVLERASCPSTSFARACSRQRLDRARAAVARLGERYPEVFWRRYGEGYTESEIARDLGLSLATVKTRAHRAKLAVAAACAASEAEEAAEQGAADERGGSGPGGLCAA
ncbi:MAG: sigma-70 family RNA polymerase sigma factor [Kofleriaceae bacterium]